MTKALRVWISNELLNISNTKFEIKSSFWMKMVQFWESYICVHACLKKRKIFLKILFIKVLHVWLKFYNSIKFLTSNIQNGSAHKDNSEIFKPGPEVIKLFSCSTQISMIFFMLIDLKILLEYADVVWDNCTLYEVNALEKIQLEAARIVTGTTKLVSLEMLYKETGWETLEVRRSKHKLCLFYKMSNSISPEYLSSLVPQPIENTTQYGLRDASNIRPPLARTQLYYKPFLPSTIRLWNDLSPETRDALTLTSFKYQMNKNIQKPPRYFTVGFRFAQIQHTRLRTL